VSLLALDAEALYAELVRGVRQLATAQTHLVGIISGGAVACRAFACGPGLVDRRGLYLVAMHRDDFAKRGLAAGGQTKLPFEVHGAHILVLDDVLNTGRTSRAVVNELFDYGRPASVKLAVLGGDRGGRPTCRCSPTSPPRAWRWPARPVLGVGQAPQ